MEELCEPLVSGEGARDGTKGSAARVAGDFSSRPPGNAFETVAVVFRTDQVHTERWLVGEGFKPESEEVVAGAEFDGVAELGDAVASVVRKLGDGFAVERRGQLAVSAHPEVGFTGPGNADGDGRGDGLAGRDGAAEPTGEIEGVGRGGDALPGFAGTAGVGRDSPFTVGAAVPVAGFAPRAAQWPGVVAGNVETSQ